MFINIVAVLYPFTRVFLDTMWCHAMEFIVSLDAVFPITMYAILGAHRGVVCLAFRPNG